MTQAMGTNEAASPCGNVMPGKPSTSSVALAMRSAMTMMTTMFTEARMSDKNMLWVKA